MLTCNEPSTLNLTYWGFVHLISPLVAFSSHVSHWLEWIGVIVRERESLFTDYQPIWASHQREGTQQVSYTIVSNTVILLAWQQWVWTCAIPLFSSLQYYCDPGWPSAEMHTCFHLNYSVLVLSVQTVFSGLSGILQFTPQWHTS